MKRSKDIGMRKSTIYIPIKNPFSSNFSEQSYIDILEIREDIIKESISDNLELRKHIEKISTHNGVDYINDASSTDIEASAKTLRKIKKPIIWIVNEVDLEVDYSVVSDLVNKKVKAIICITKNNNNIFKVFGNNSVQLIVNVASIFEAVKIAFYLAHEGDVVLFSPVSERTGKEETLRERSALYNTTVQRLQTIAY